MENLPRSHACTALRRHRGARGAGPARSLPQLPPGKHPSPAAPPPARPPEPPRPSGAGARGRSSHSPRAGLPGCRCPRPHGRTHGPTDALPPRRDLAKFATHRPGFYASWRPASPCCCSLPWAGSSPPRQEPAGPGRAERGQPRLPSPAPGPLRPGVPLPSRRSQEVQILLTLSERKGMGRMEELGRPLPGKGGRPGSHGALPAPGPDSAGRCWTSAGFSLARLGAHPAKTTGRVARGKGCAV